MTERKFFSGNTVEQAVMKAGRHFEISTDELDFRSVEKKHGFLRLRRSVVIEVDPSAPRLTLSDDEALKKAQSIEPEVQARPTEAEGAPKMVDLPAQSLAARERFPEAEGATAEAAAEAVQVLLELAGAEMESSILEGDERLEIELSGADANLLLRNQGRPLLAVQHLTPRLIRGLIGESVFCRVDCDGFHEIREERLRDLAQRVASEVSERGRSRMLESMAPDERRIVHMTLADDPKVTTESQGSGFLKRVKVLPL